MSDANLNLENQFGEVSENYVLGGTLPAISPIAEKTIVSNLTSGTALAAANTLSAVAAVLPSNAAVAALDFTNPVFDPITISLSTGNTYTDAAVNAAVNAAIASIILDLKSVVSDGLGSIATALQSNN